MEVTRTHRRKPTRSITMMEWVTCHLFIFAFYRLILYFISSLVLSCLVFFRFVFPCLLLSCFGFSCSVLLCIFLSCFVLSCLVLFWFFLFCLLANATSYELAVCLHSSNLSSSNAFWYKTSSATCIASVLFYSLSLPLTLHLPLSLPLSLPPSLPPSLYLYFHPHPLMSLYPSIYLSISCPITLTPTIFLSLSLSH